MKLETFRHQMGQGFDRLLPKYLDSPNTILFVFGAPEYVECTSVFMELRSGFPQSILMGCSSAGEIFSSHVYDHSLTVAVVQFEASGAKIVTCPIADMTESYSIGQKVANQLSGSHQGHALSGVFVLSDGLRINGSELVRGIGSVLDEKVVVTGGLAGDGSRFQRTWVLNGDLPTENCVAAVGLYGHRLRLGHGSQGGWDIFGPERIITRSEENILYELDGKPALNLYKEYLGEKAAGLPATALLFPLQVRLCGSDEKSVVRTVLAVDDERQTMTFAGNVPQGALTQLMRANFDRLIEGAGSAAALISSSVRGPDILTIAISCVGRRLVLGERIDEEVEATLERLPPGTRQIGFYSYGEISPFVHGRTCELHNQTMTLTTICEVEAG